MNRFRPTEQLASAPVRHYDRRAERTFPRLFYTPFRLLLTKLREGTLTLR